MEAASKLTCGLCGYIRPRLGAADTAWTSLCRAVYCTGSTDSNPRLSGIGFHRHDDADQLATPVPRAARRRFDDTDLNPLSDFVHIRGIRPPPVDLPEAEQAEYSWGFVFHDACWTLLEQASAGGNVARDKDTGTVVDIHALWRILQSVPCAHDLPNWGHNYGGLYLGVAKDQARGEHFVLLSSNSNLVIPSTYSDPFRVPELQSIMARLRIDEALPDSYHREGRVSAVSLGSRRKREEDIAFGSGLANNDAMLSLEDGLHTPASIAISPACESPHLPTDSDSAEIRDDPFAFVPLEIREMILTTLTSADVCNLRLSSRAMAATPLTQYFFSSRFWPGRELETIFDGFLLHSSHRLGLDWHALYRFMRSRLRFNQVCLGEKNRLRIWRQTVRPLARAAEALGAARLSGHVAGNIVFSGPGFWQAWNSIEQDDSAGADASRGGDRDNWRTVTTVKQLDPESWGDMGRRVTRAEVKLPKDRLVDSVVVSVVEFFDVRYITGLSFVLKPGKQAVDGDESPSLPEDQSIIHLGYITARSRDQIVLSVPRRRPQQQDVLSTTTTTDVPGLLQGFHAAVDECGFRGLALIAGRAVESEYLSWAGQAGTFRSYPIRIGGGESARLGTVSAVFDVSRFVLLLQSWRKSGVVSLIGVQSMWKGSLANI